MINTIKHVHGKLEALPDRPVLEALVYSVFGKKTLCLLNTFIPVKTIRFSLTKKKTATELIMRELEQEFSTGSK
jgi:hypothetical protein